MIASKAEISRASRLLREAGTLLFSSLGTTVLSLTLAIGTYDVEEFIGYFQHPVILLLNWLPILLLQTLLYCLCRRHWLAFLLTAASILIASVGNYYKIQTRFEPFTFQDMDSILAGLQVAGDYSLTVNKRVLLAAVWVILGVPVLALFCRGKSSRRFRLTGLVLSLAVAVGLWLGVYRSEAVYLDTAFRNTYIGNLTDQQNYIANGFVYPFLHSMAQTTEQAPEGYAPELAVAALEAYEDADIPAERAVNLMVLQLESFTDLEAMGFPGIAPETYQVLHRLQDESISGTMVANVIGGGTIRTERCVLTGGLEMPRISEPCSSYVRYFNGQGYFTTGSHPNRPDFYNRVNVADYLGFSEYLFLNNHYLEITGGKWNCDAEFLPETFRLFREKAETGQRVFSFNVSLQGHGPYHLEEVNYSGQYFDPDGVSQQTCDDLNAYLALAAETQDVLLAQLESLRTEAIPAVLLIYGDHNPAFSSAAVYEECGVDFDLTREEDFIRYYGTPYLIWANDAAKELLGSDFIGEGPTVSPGYLMNLLFDALGWQGSAYLQYMGSMLEHLPILSTNGMVLEDSVFSNSLSPEGAALLEECRIVQYYEQHLPVEEP